MLRVITCKIASSYIIFQTETYCDKIGDMSVRENIRNLFKPRGVKEAEEIAKLEGANIAERRTTAAYLRGNISLGEYNQRMEETSPITRIDFKRLASHLNRPH